MVSCSCMASGLRSALGPSTTIDPALVLRVFRHYVLLLLFVKQLSQDQ